ncbi:hypothetical protein PJP07_31080, partial [Mycobacterium kansasii]
MKAFSRLLGGGVEMGLVKGFKVDNLDFQVSHLQYADDTSLFCEADSLGIEYPRAIIVRFEAVLGLKVN